MKNFAILFALASALAVNIVSASNTSALAKLQNEFQLMKGDLQKTKSDLNQVKQKNKHLQDEVNELYEEKDVRNGICKIKNQPCGDCLCVEDYSLMERYFCDCRSRPERRDCKEHHLQGERISGLYKITKNLRGKTIQVYCDHTTDGGGWTVLQRRLDGSENFFRNWTVFKQGFGKIQKEHWIGNENIYLLTAQAYFKGSEVRFDMMVKGESKKRWAKYSRFSVSHEHTGFMVHASGFTGDVVDHFSYHNGMRFTTYDRDHDTYAPANCAVYSFGAWWHKSCNNVNLNGQYDRFSQQGALQKSFSWYPYKLTFSEMKVRRK